MQPKADAEPAYLALDLWMSLGLPVREFDETRWPTGWRDSAERQGRR